MTRMGTVMARGKSGSSKRFIRRNAAWIQPTVGHPRPIDGSAATTLTMRAKRMGSEVSGLPGEAAHAERSRAAAGRERSPQPQRVEHFREPMREPGPLQIGKANHRRTQHQTLERAASGMGDAQHDRRSHRMTEPEPGPRTGRPQDFGDEGIEVALVERKIVDMALARILQLSRRPALAAPIERRDREAAIEQLADRLEIFLDEFGAAPEHRDRASNPARRRPARRAQPQSVDCVQRFDDSARRDRIIGRWDERHEGALGARFGVLWRAVARDKAQASATPS